MMSLGKNLILATLKGHSDPPLSQMDPKPFFCDSRPLEPNLTPAVGSQWGGGGGLTTCAIYMSVFGGGDWGFLGN